MVRKASGTEKDKMKRMVDMDTAANLAPSYEQLPGLADELPNLAGEYLGINEQIAVLDKRKKEIQATVKAIHAEAEAPIITGDFFVCEMVTSHTTRKLDPKLLLTKGVAIDVIESAYTGGEAFQYLQIRPRAEKDAT